ncbi:hypothetical protein PENSPDRAFT_503407 [Peniophora sp. CONT]|nr:hypothetical protein PENSPDRAFT_503407 [Peniophora sp. CONT]
MSQGIFHCGHPSMPYSVADAHSLLSRAAGNNAAYLRTRTYADIVPRIGDLMRVEGLQNGCLELVLVEGANFARGAVTPELVEVKEEPNPQGVKSESPPPVAEVQTGAHARSTHIPPLEPSASKLSTAKRPGKATKDEFYRMALYIADHGGGERHGKDKWQSFTKENGHRTATSWAKIYESHIQKIHVKVEEIRGTRRASAAM